MLKERPVNGWRFMRQQMFFGLLVGGLACFLIVFGYEAFFRYLLFQQGAAIPRPISAISLLPLIVGTVMIAVAMRIATKPRTDE